MVDKVHETLTASSPREVAKRVEQMRLEMGARRGRDLKHTEIAARLGVSKQRWGGYMKGRSAMPPDLLRLAAAVLEANPGYLMWGELPREGGPIPPEVAALLAAVERMQAEAGKKRRAAPKPSRPRPKAG